MLFATGYTQNEISSNYLIDIFIFGYNNIVRKIKRKRYKEMTKKKIIKVEGHSTGRGQVINFYGENDIIWTTGEVAQSGEFRGESCTPQFYQPSDIKQFINTACTNGETIEFEEQEKDIIITTKSGTLTLIKIN